MREFLEWAFDLETPGWVAVSVIGISSIASIFWIIASLHFESIVMILAPIAFITHLVFAEYKRHKGNDK